MDTGVQVKCSQLLQWQQIPILQRQFPRRGHHSDDIAWARATSCLPRKWGNGTLLIASRLNLNYDLRFTVVCFWYFVAFAFDVGRVFHREEGVITLEWRFPDFEPRLNLHEVRAHD